MFDVDLLTRYFGPFYCIELGQHYYEIQKMTLWQLERVLQTESDTVFTGSHMQPVANAKQNGASFCLS